LGETRLALPAAGALLATGALAAVAALAARGAGRAVCTGLAAGTVIVATGRLIWLALPEYRLFGLITAAALLFLIASRLPERARNGALSATGAVAGPAGVVVVGLALFTGLATIGAALPPWHAPIESYYHRLEQLVRLDWQLPAALVVAASVALLTAPRPMRLGIALAAGSLLALATPASLHAPYWTIPVTTGLASLGQSLQAVFTEVRGQSRTALLRTGDAALLGLHAVAVCLAAPSATIVGLAIVVAAGELVALVAYRRSAPLVGGVACAAALFALPGLVAASVHAFGGTDRWTAVAAMGAVTLGLSVAWSVRVGPYAAPAATAVAAGATTVTIATVFSAEPTTLYAAYAALLSAVATLLPPNRSPKLLLRPAVPLAWAAIGAVPALVAVLVRPYAQLLNIWAGPGSTVRPVVDLQDVFVLACLAGAATLTAYGLLYRKALVSVGLPTGALVLFVLPAAIGAPWPIDAVTALILGLAAGLGVALWTPAFGLLFIAAAGTGAGLAGLLATRTGTLAGLSALLAAAVVAAFAGRNTLTRFVGWVLASATFLILPPVACTAAGLNRVWAGYALLAAAMLLLGVAAIVSVTALALIPEVLAWCGATGALGLVVPGLRSAAIVLVVWGAALGATALRRDRGPKGRYGYAIAAIAYVSLAWWLFLWSARIGIPEAYTLPPALMTLGLGASFARSRPELHSWIAYGPGLLAALLPSLAWSLPLDSSGIRRLLLGAAAVGTVLVGARVRLRAPLAIGGGVLLVLALHELVLLGVRTSYWVPLAIAGTVLVVCGATYERRLRDVRRLRQTYESFR
jgi:hypothetical protein